MIKFFRKIRQRLLTESKFSKYLLYAIGEIVLVVIGILIALQINTWQKEKANQVLETKVLKELNRNLNKDLDEIRADILRMDNVQIACIGIIEHLKNNTNPSGKFSSHVSKLKQAPHFNPIKSGYDFLHSKGVDIINNDSLREMISNHYEMDYVVYNKYENERILFKIHQTNDLLMNYFTWLNISDNGEQKTFRISNEDYFKIKDDRTFEKLVAATAWENRLLNNRANGIEKKIINLMKSIDKELKINN